MTPEEYKRNAGLSILDQGYIDSVVLAFNKLGSPHVWAKAVFYDGFGMPTSWVITNDPRKKAIMFKETGLFTYGESNKDLEQNSFSSYEDAANCFELFYK